MSTFHDILQLMENGLDVSLVLVDLHMLHKVFNGVTPLPLLQKLKDIGLTTHSAVDCLISV